MEKGDYIYNPNTGVSFILKSFDMDGDGNAFCVPFVSFYEGRIVFGVESILITKGMRINNQEIIDELDKALFKEGYYFDAAKLDMSEKRWMPEVGDTYYSPFYGEKIWYESAIDIGSWKMGFVCKTDHEADALIDVAREAIRKYLTNKK